jgi:glycosyltransferase involved in cell wall biosynthesis
MKILFYCPLPFLLAHGGAQTQVEKTKAALEHAGVEVEHLCWWDAQQAGDLIHVFGLVGNEYLQQARLARMPVVLTQLFTESCNRSAARLARQGWMIRALQALPFGGGIKQQLSWRTYQLATHNVVGLEAERRVLQLVYRVPPEKISVVPLGLSAAYLNAGPGPRTETHLITTGTITARKNSLALAEMAHAAQVPVLFVGKPYHPTDAYWRSFEKLIDGRWVKYHPHVGSEAEMIALLRAARGFVFMSAFENWCLSAHEAAACGLPLLVQDQNWARERFGDQARYFPTIGVTAENIKILRQFHQDAATLPAPRVKIYSWNDTAAELKKIYERVLAAPG